MRRGAGSRKQEGVLGIPVYTKGHAIVYRPRQLNNPDLEAIGHAKVRREGKVTNEVG